MTSNAQAWNTKHISVDNLGSKNSLVMKFGQWCFLPVWYVHVPAHITYLVTWWSRLVADHQLLYLETLRQQSSVSSLTKFGYFSKKQQQQQQREGDGVVNLELTGVSNG